MYYCVYLLYIKEKGGKKKAALTIDMYDSHFKSVLLVARINLRRWKIRRRRIIIVDE